MVWFLCFHGHVHCPKPKKAVERSAETKHNTVEGCSQNKDLNFSNKTMSSNQLLPRTQEDTHSNISTEKVRSSYSLEHCWESEEMNCNPRPEGNTVVHLGSELDKEDRISGSIEIEREIYQEFLVDVSRDNRGVMEPLDSKHVRMNSVNEYQEALSYESLQLNSDAMHEEAIFSIGDSKQLGREFNEDFYASLCGDHDAKSGDHALHTPRLIAKSYSLPNIEATPLVDIQPRCRSTGDLCALDVKSKEFVKNEAHGIVNQGRVNFVSNNGEEKCGNHVDDDFDHYSYVGLAKDWIIPRTDEVGMVNNFQEEPSVQKWDEIQSREFKIKRIEEWVSDLQHTSSWEETDEASYSGDQIKRGSTALEGISSAKLSAKIIPGMEAAKNYISSLTVTSTSAQLANHGLVVIPFLSAFASLRAINLSGNAIVRITAGALPRGLHMLNLSKNSISTIEGLRELTRLRILDLSYNRIFRIGHGLASCSSLKELYLAGNKISEVEGLHRLLKLNVLDLRFNKISTAKCLGQLAANYSSLQAISLEGNPAQRHVGDEQLKKYLQGLLPHLAYFNRHPTKVSSLKDTTDRAARSGVNMQQFDRSLRSEHKTTRKVNHSGGAHKYSVSSGHGRTQATGSPKRSRGRHGHLPPSGTRGTTHKYNHHHYPDIDSKVQRFQLDLSMRRSRSEGSLGAS